MIKCIRCSKEIEHANATNAKYIINVNDKRTWGIDIIEKVISAPLSKARIEDILKEKTAMQREYITNDAHEVIKTIEHPYTIHDLAGSTEIFADNEGRREITIEEEIETPKTAIVCLDCLEENDTIIW